MEEAKVTVSSSETALIKSLATVHVGMKQHGAMLNKVRRYTISDEGRIWKNRWFRLNMFNFNFCLIRSSIEPNTYSCLCYKCNMKMHSGAFSDYLKHVRTTGHRNSDLIYYELGNTLPKNALFPN